MGVPHHPRGSFKNQSLPHFPMIHFVSTTSFSIHFRRTIILREFSGRIAFANHVSLGERTKKNVLWEIWKWGRGGGGMDLQRVNGYIDCLSYGFKTSKTQTAHLLSISAVNFILFA